MSIKMDLQETSISEEEDCSKPIYFPFENSRLALCQNTAFENSIACSESIAVLPILQSKMEQENNGSKEESKKTDDIQENQEINLLKRTIEIQNENINLLMKEITKLKNESDKLLNNKKTIKINSKQSQKQRQADQQQLEQFKPEQMGISQTEINQDDNNNENEIKEVKKGRKKQKNNDLTNSPPKKPAKEPKNQKQLPERIVINGSLGQGVFPKTLVKIACWNINGIRAVIKKEKIHSFLKRKYDVICLNETKIDEESLQKEGLYHQLNSIDSSYEQYYSCSVKKGYSGVAIFSKEKAISVKQGIDATEFDVEGRVLTAEFHQFIVMTVYVPYKNEETIGRQEYRNDFDRKFKEYVTKLQNSYPDKPVIICGDFNVAHQDIDVKYPKESNKLPGMTEIERNNFDSLLISGWVDSFRQKNPTASKYTSGQQLRNYPYNFLEWRFDYFLINEKFINQCKFSDIDSNTQGSDHKPILFFLEILNTKICESLSIENEIQQNQTMIGENKQKTNMVIFENKEEQ